MVKMTDKDETLEILNRILEKSKINDELKEAVVAMIEAVKQNNILLVSELSSVKSLVSGTMKSKFKEYPYKEDHDYNQIHIGDSVYSLLDTIHHEYSFKLDRLPSGMMVISSNGIEHAEHTNNSEHPVVKKINAEFKRTWSKRND